MVQYTIGGQSNEPYGFSGFLPPVFVIYMFVELFPEM